MTNTPNSSQTHVNSADRNVTAHTNKPVLLLPRHLPPGFMQALENIAELRVADISARPVPPAKLMRDASVYLTTAVDPVSADLIHHFPDSIRLIASIGIGFEHIDLAAARQRGILVSNTPVVTEDTADLCFALVLACCRRLSVCERLLRNEQWQASTSQLGQRVHGKTLGIVGFGAIGQAVARRARGFAMPVIYWDPNRKPEAEAEFKSIYCESFDHLLAQADIVSLNCQLSESNRHLINAAALAQMKQGAVLINTARGGLVDEAALVDALVSGHLGGAGLDVFEFEPRVNPGLLALDNVTLLPHIGSASVECRSDMAASVIANIRHFLANGAPLNVVGL